VQYHHALELFRQVGDQSGEAVAMLNIGLACQADRGYWQQAADSYHEVVALSDKAGYYHGQAIALCNLIDVLLKLGKVQQASAQVEQLHNLYARTNNAYGQAVVEHDRGTVCLAQGDAETALIHFQRAKEISDWATDAEEMAPAETNIGRAYTMLGQWEEAEAAYQRALDLWVTFTELPGELETWLSLVELYRQMKAWGKLESTLKTARELAQRIERDDALALLNAALADAHFAADEVQAGCEAYATALRDLAKPGENDRKADYLQRVILQAQAQVTGLQAVGRTEAASALRTIIRDNTQQETNQELIQ